MIRKARYEDIPRLMEIFDKAKEIMTELERLSLIVEIPDMVRLMKQTVPEFISKNSIYEQYDQPQK